MTKNKSKVHTLKDMRPRKDYQKDARHKDTQLYLPQTTGHRNILPSQFQSTSSLKTILEPTVVYDTYWKFAHERQNIFFSRITEQNGPWTNDQILTHYKFTNAYRASDRVSQYLIRNVIYSGDKDISNQFFRIILFKIFNRIETWELLEEKIGIISVKNFSLTKYDRVLSDVINSGKRIYSAAYIMPTGGRGTQYDRKHRMHLHLLQKMLKDDLPLQIHNSKTMSNVFDLLKSYPGIGNFLAYQYAIDINYSDITNFSENDFVMPGPGAINGIQKCFKNPNRIPNSEIIKIVTAHQNDEFARLGLNFKNLWGRPLQLIDCQNLFCETDKYARVMHPEFRGKTTKTRIKQKFSPTPKQINFWYPPKWELNKYIENGELP